MKRYFVILAISALVLGSCLMGFNWTVDPYKIFINPSLSQLNSTKSIVVMNERIFKTVNLARQQPSVVLIGTSRADNGLDASHPIFSGKKTLNLATSGQPYIETKMLIEHLDSKPHQIIFGLDFYPANINYKSPSDFVPENFSSFRKFQLLRACSKSPF